MVSTREKKFMVKNSFYDPLLQQMQHRQVACSWKKNIVTNETMIMENDFQVLIRW